MRRDLSQAERNVAAAIGARDKLGRTTGSTNAHWELSALAERLAVAQAEVTAAEESWLALAAEAEDLGLTP